MTWWGTTLWNQFGAAIDVLENAISECPDALWTGRLWEVHSDRPLPDAVAEFWYIVYHTLFWLDLYLAGTSEGFSPPPPFGPTRDDEPPEKPYTKEELRSYLEQLRQKCRTTYEALTEESACRNCSFRWIPSDGLTYFELQLYSMRHVQEHASQLHMFLGQHRDQPVDTWVSRVGER